MTVTPQTTDRTARRRLSTIAIVVGAAGLALACAAASQAEDAPPAAAAAPGDGGTTPATSPATNAPAAAARPTGSNVRIVFKIIPSGNATVMWGKKRLGIIKPKASLVVQRPRDSGPLDVVVKSSGFVTVHTRAYTFTDTTVAVKLTPVDKKNTLYGYREELPPDDGGVPPGDPDGGVP